MNRLGIILATVCAVLAVLVAALGGVRGGHEALAKAAHSVKAAATTKLASSNPKASGDDGDMVIRFAKNPEPIPLFMARDLDGDVISTAAYKGKVIIVNFWATWCPPCREEIPELIKLQSEYKDQLQIISVSEDESPEPVVKAFAQSAHMNYPVIPFSPEIEKDFGGVPALPTSFLINRDGGVVAKHVGFYPLVVYNREVRALLDLPVDARIELFEDTGQIFMKNAANATELPDVDLSGLTLKQKQAALKRMNSEGCTCGCKLTIAECRINDTGCSTSRDLAAKIVKEIKAGQTSTPPAKTDPDSSSD